MPIRVLVVDDHPVIHEALGTVFQTAPDIESCGYAGTAERAIDLIEEMKPDVAVVDIWLKDIHGLGLVSRIQEEYPGVKVVIFSMCRESAYAERAIRAGALGYVVKTESTTTVLDAIRAAKEGRVYLSERIAARILSRVVRKTPRTGIDTLTDQEMIVFQMLGQSLTVDEIAERLGVSPKTVMAYRRRAKEKLGLQTIGSLVQHAYMWTQGWGVGRVKDQSLN